MYYKVDYSRSPYLAHHGIKGQKWGVRRWQYENGRLTPEGVEHYARASLHRDTLRNIGKGALKGAGVGGAIGAVTGAAAGSVMGPVGAVVGGIAGGIGYAAEGTAAGALISGVASVVASQMYNDPEKAEADFINAVKEEKGYSSKDIDEMFINPGDDDIAINSLDQLSSKTRKKYYKMQDSYAVKNRVNEYLTNSEGSSVAAIMKKTQEQGEQIRRK